MNFANRYTYVSIDTLQEVQARHTLGAGKRLLALQMMQLVGIGAQDKHLIAKRYLFRLLLEDIVNLPTWQVEYTFVVQCFNAEIGIPVVLIDIVVGYSGSAHGDALMALASEGSIGLYTEKLSSQRPVSVRKTVNQMLEYITRLIKYPKLPKPVPNLSKIITLLKKIIEYDDWEDSLAGLKIADIFYQVLMLAWPPPAKIDN